MKRLTTDELRKLEIVNLCDGKRLGYATDFVFDRDDARILSLILPGSDGFFGIGKEDGLEIPWRMIECFGEDTILVRLSQQELSACSCTKQKKKFRF